MSPGGASGETPTGIALLDRTYSNVMCPPGGPAPHRGIFIALAKAIGVSAEEFETWAANREWSLDGPSNMPGMNYEVVDGAGGK